MPERFIVAAVDMRRVLPVVVTVVLAGQLPASAHSSPGDHRGLVAATTPGGVHLSWRLLGREATGATATGLSGPAFAVYRNGKRIATVTDTTTFVDTDAKPGARYQVSPVRHGVPLGRSKAVTAWANSYHDLPQARGRRDPGRRALHLLRQRCQRR